MTFGKNKVSPETIENITDALKKRSHTKQKMTDTVGIAHGLSGFALSLLSSANSEKQIIKELHQRK